MTSRARILVYRHQQQVTFIDNEPAKAYVKANGSALKILDTDYAVEDYAICFSKDNTELQKKVNEALKELKKDGTVQKIVDKYIKAD